MAIDLEKIIFEDLPSTQTPVIAENLNKIQTNIEKPLKILDERGKRATVYISSEVSNSYENQYANVPFNSFKSMTDKLTFDSQNKTIIIGEDINNIQIEGFVNIKTSANVDFYGLYIHKNDTFIGETFYDTSKVEYNYYNLYCKIANIDVKKGDIIKMSVRTIGTTSVSNQTFIGNSKGTMTALNIEIID